MPSSLRGLTTFLRKKNLNAKVIPLFFIIYRGSEEEREGLGFRQKIE
jgi:hypothetical protein